MLTYPSQTNETTEQAVAVVALVVVRYPMTSRMAVHSENRSTLLSRAAHAGEASEGAKKPRLEMSTSPLMASRGVMESRLRMTGTERSDATAHGIMLCMVTDTLAP